MEVPINPNALEQLAKRSALIEHYNHLVGSLELEMKAYLKHTHPDLDMLKDLAVDLERKVIRIANPEQSE